MREENLRGSLEGICFSCKTEQTIPFREELHLNTIYVVGNCPRCDYEHWIFQRKI